MSYRAPVEDMLFVMKELAGADHVLTQAPSLRDRVVEGAAGVTGMAADSF